MQRILLFSFYLFTTYAFSQSGDSETIKEIYNQALSQGKSYEMLQELCINIGPRLSGSPGAAAAVEWE